MSSPFLLASNCSGYVAAKKLKHKPSFALRFCQGRCRFASASLRFFSSAARAAPFWASTAGSGAAWPQPAAINAIRKHTADNWRTLFFMVVIFQAKVIPESGAR